MSNSDQQYPYGQQPPQYGQQPPQYGQQAPYGDQEPYDAAPYDSAPYGVAPDGSAWPAGQAPQQPAAPQEPVNPQGRAPGHTDQGATQTWQGQTWDTQYQPTIRPEQQAAYQQAPHAAPYPQQAAYQQAAQPVPQPAPQTGSHSGPQSGSQFASQGSTSGSYPLPPEVPFVPEAPAGPAGAPVQGGSGYSAPTTLGNSRITDAQRARAEGRSPIIAPGMQPAAITAGLGLLIALGAAIGPYALLVPLVLLQAVTAAGWFRLNGMWPARQGIALAFAGGFVADVVLLAAGRDNAPAAILGTLGVWVLLTLVLQLRSHAGADERMYGLTATVASAALAVLAAGHLAAAPDAVTVGGIAVAVAVLVRALPLPGPASVVVALLVAAGAGAAVGGLTGIGTQGAFLGLAAGGCALIGLRVASYDYPSRFVHMTAGVALPLTAAAPAVYLIGRAIA
ncbi:hypothetical protein OG257_18080 [Streptomyces sp. NBC_00683]|uniref:hypothetical protein n=1 Tax=Streptomyces sp. NBC_00683 TaxID=2903670 RepID=UPI002E2F30E0|nr:hypothetical protein [Streptomyces sp. NBC_00683]